MTADEARRIAIDAKEAQVSPEEQQAFEAAIQTILEWAKKGVRVVQVSVPTAVDNNIRLRLKDLGYRVEWDLMTANITYNDKMWVCTRLMTRNQKFQFAIACAESVLHIFESRRPEDTRVRDLIDFMKTIPNVETMSDDTRSKLLELRNNARDAAAAYAATAYATDAYAATTIYATTYATSAAYATDRVYQENLNLILLADIMENVV